MSPTGSNITHIQHAFQNAIPDLPEAKKTPLPQNVDLSLLWQHVLTIASERLSLPSVEMWLMPLQVVGVEEAHIKLGCPSAFSQLWVSRHYLPMLQGAFMQALDLSELPQISLSVSETNDSPAPMMQSNTAVAASALPVARATMPAAPQVISNRPMPVPVQAIVPVLNPKYTFENIVVAEHNHFACAAAKAVIANPGQQYNPLFIHGDVGLGKTHLMQSIGHAISEANPNKNIAYVTTEQFANEMIAAISNKTIKRFQDKFRNLDVLMMDDIQFLEGKQRTQEEVFHIFNALVDAGKQIIFTSDRPPTKLTRLETRLTSRFASGLTVDIVCPNLNARAEIVKQKAAQANLVLSAEMQTLLAQSYSSNVRELEGAIKKMTAYQAFNTFSVSPSTEQLMSLLGLEAKSTEQLPMTQNLEVTLASVAAYYNVSVSDLKSASRTKTLNETRQTVVYILRELTGASYPQLGVLLGNRSHSNMMIAFKKVAGLLENSTSLKIQMDKVLDKLRCS